MTNNRGTQAHGCAGFRQRVPNRWDAEATVTLASTRGALSGLTHPHAQQQHTSARNFSELCTRLRSTWTEEVAGEVTDRTAYGVQGGGGGKKEWNGGPRRRAHGSAPPVAQGGCKNQSSGTLVHVDENRGNEAIEAAITERAPEPNACRRQLVP